jgi:energy-coupling factor transporter ATP-binding protein EcfA2
MGPPQHPTPAALRGALVEAIEAARGIAEPAPLRAALAILEAPWRVVVVGRTSAGKSTLVALLTGARRPVGLGGVTAEVEEVPRGEDLVVDTPGIDDPDDAVLTLAPALAEADAAVWVVDGLQPMTASERAVLREVLPPGLPLAVVVSKLDLVEPEEHDAVVGRVRELSHGARDVVGLDLRRARPADVADLGRLDPPGPRRAAALRQAMSRIRAALQAAPAPVGPEELEAAVRDRLRGVVRELDARIAALSLDDPHEAELALRRGVERVLGELLAPWSSRGGPPPRSARGAPPRLPLPDVTERSVLSQVRDELAGAEGARRALKASAARWLQEVQWVLHDGWAGADEARARVAARRRLDEALEALDALLRAADELRSPVR